MLHSVGETPAAIAGEAQRLVLADEIVVSDVERRRRDVILKLL